MLRYWIGRIYVFRIYAFVSSHRKAACAATTKSKPNSMRKCFVERRFNQSENCALPKICSLLKHPTNTNATLRLHTMKLSSQFSSKPSSSTTHTVEPLSLFCHSFRRRKKVHKKRRGKNRLTFIRIRTSANTWFGIDTVFIVSRRFSKPSTIRMRPKSACYLNIEELCHRDNIFQSPPTDWRAIGICLPLRFSWKINYEFASDFPKRKIIADDNFRIRSCVYKERKLKLGRLSQKSIMNVENGPHTHSMGPSIQTHLLTERRHVKACNERNNRSVGKLCSAYNLLRLTLHILVEWKIPAE